jgi:hypothetical protein
VDPEGTWTWGFVRRDGKSVEAKVKLTRADGTLRGVAVGPDGREIPVEGLKVEGDQVRFQVTRETGGRKYTTLYTGRIEGNRIKGKAIQGRETTGLARDWEAIRAVSGATGPTRP